MNTLIRNGRVLLDNEINTDVDLLINDIGIIVAQDNLEAQADVVIDANQQLVLPGIVDLHGDAFERQMLPRPKVHFPTDMALLETDRQMMINGITTAFHGVTYSWETGLRGRDSAIKVIEHVEKLRDRLICDTRIHLRWETYNLEGENDLAFSSPLHHGGVASFVVFNWEDIRYNRIKLAVIEQPPKLFDVLLLLRRLFAQEAPPKNANQSTTFQ